MLEGSFVIIVFLMWWRIEFATPKYALWCKDYFEQKEIEKQIQEKLSLYLPKSRT